MIRRMSIFGIGVVGILIFAAGSLYGQHSFARKIRHAPALTQSFRGSILLSSTDSTLLRSLGGSDNIKIARVGPHLYRIDGMGERQLKELLSDNRSFFAQPYYRKAKTELEVSSLDLSVNAVSTVHNLFPGVDGEGLAVSIKENAFDVNDLDLRGRAVESNLTSPTVDVHATTIATIVGGAGNSSPESKGVAWKTTITGSNFENLMPDPIDELASQNVSVQNHSYGVDVENFYGIESEGYDLQAWQSPGLLHVFSAGNAGAQVSTEGPYAGIPGFANLTGQFKMSKNSIAVGGTNQLLDVQSFSSRGPAYDGRVKPEVVAYGGGGTSEAAAVVSGASVLLQDHYKKLTGDLPPSALIKALLINGAVDRGRPGVDFENGFGSVNLNASIATLTQDNFRIDSLAHSEVRSFSIQVPASYEFKITLVWTDPPAQAGDASALVNDLDLEVLEESSGHVIRPWVLSTYPAADSLTKNSRRGSDHLNNVEQVSFTVSAAGQYTIRVRGFNISTTRQAFALAYAINDGIKWIFPNEADAVKAGNFTVPRWSWYGGDEQAIAEWKPAGEEEWVPVDTVPLSSGLFIWNVPELQSRTTLRLRSLSNTMLFLTDTFTISVQPALSVGYRCGDEHLIYWRPLEGVEEYRLLTMGEKFLQPLTTLSDTVFRFNADQLPDTVFAVEPIVSGASGYRSRSLNAKSLNANCYIISFLPREFVTDRVGLVLTLGTTEGLTTIVFEREGATGFVQIGQIAPTSNNRYVFEDPAPHAGTNRYRVRLLRSNGAVVFSSIEEVIFVRDNEISFFPNPALHGDPIFIVLKAASAKAKIYDMNGRFVGDVIDDGALKTIESVYLVPGTYIVKAFTDEGQVLTGKIVVY